ncbi:MAG TPA: hypothetical protein PLL54_02560 [Dermatophilaceae bacterium]|nr:hypothetical protein [Dermatophilaceae bacterium]
MPEQGAAPAPGRDWRGFAQWAGVGIGSMWASWTILGYGWVIAVITGVAAFRLANSTDPGRAAWGFVAGLGLVPMWVGWADRASAATTTTPWIWLGSGALTVLVAVVAFLWPRQPATLVGPSDSGLES